MEKEDSNFEMPPNEPNIVWFLEVVSYDILYVKIEIPIVDWNVGGGRGIKGDISWVIRGDRQSKSVGTKNYSTSIKTMKTPGQVIDKKLHWSPPIACYPMPKMMAISYSTLE